jgi:hypothetical protein
MICALPLQRKKKRVLLCLLGVRLAILSEAPPPLAQVLVDPPPLLLLSVVAKLSKLGEGKVVVVAITSALSIVLIPLKLLRRQLDLLLLPLCLCTLEMYKRYSTLYEDRGSLMAAIVSVQFTVVMLTNLLQHLFAPPHSLHGR